MSLFLTLFACGTVQQAAQITAADQVESGSVQMPTQENPVALGSQGMMYLYCANADGGCFGTFSLVFAGTSPDFPLNWDPALSDRAFGTYTAPNGSMAFVTQFPYPSAGRGDAAEPDAVMVDWETGDNANLGEMGLNDGWYNLPTANGTPYIQIISDCGHPHPNIVWGWDVYGEVSLPANVASFGEDYCAE
jgi:hypothetical protein